MVQLLGSAHTLQAVVRTNNSTDIRRGQSYSFVSTIVLHWAILRFHFGSLKTRLQIPIIFQTLLESSTLDLLLYLLHTPIYERPTILDFNLSDNTTAAFYTGEHCEDFDDIFLAWNNSTQTGSDTLNGIFGASHLQDNQADYSSRRRS